MSASLLRPVLPRPGLALLVAAAFFLAPCVPGGRPSVVTPPDQSALDGLPAAVQIDFGAPLPETARIRVVLLTGIDPLRDGETPPRRLTNLSARFGNLAGQRFGNAQLAEGDLEVGRSTLHVNVDRDGNGVAEFATSSTFSFEPEIDLDLAARCDILNVDPTSRVCLLPFPNDRFTVADADTDTGRRVNLQLDTMPFKFTPPNRLEFVDPSQMNRNDGFSPGAMILAYFDDLVLEDAAGSPITPITDLAASLHPDSPIAVLDADTLERQPHWAELDDESNRFPTNDLQRPLIVRPGINFRDGHRYLVAMRGLRDAAGEPIQPGRGFRIYRDRIPTFRPLLEERRAHMEEIFDLLAAAGIERSDLVLAWDFTVASKRNLSEHLLHMRDESFGSLAGAAPSFNVSSVEERPPGDTLIWRHIRGTFDVPLYLTNGGAPRGLLVLDDDGLPVRQETAGGQPAFYPAPFFCNIPRSISAVGGDPVVPGRAGVYGHGLLGAGDEVNQGQLKAMAFEHHFVFCATNWIGMAEDDLDSGAIYEILEDLSNFPFISDRLHQGMLNTLFLGRLLRHPDGFASHLAFQAGAASTPVLATAPVAYDGNPQGIITGGAPVYYDGNSQGGIAGGAATAFAQDWERAVLGVPGMNYSTLLQRSVDFSSFDILLRGSYKGNLMRLLAFALIQMPWDRVEANGHANHLTHDPYPNTPVHRVLLHVAFGDFQVANASAEVEARSIGASAHQPALPAGVHWDVNPLWNIPTLVYPHAGSALVYWDSGNFAPPNGNLPPAPQGSPEADPPVPPPPRPQDGKALTDCAFRHDEDPHECPRRQPSARLQKSEFLKPGGVVIDVCGNAPCEAPLN